MGFAPLVALVGLVFGMIAIKLMSIVENAQIVVVKGVRKSNRLRRESLKGIKSKKIVTFAISTHQLLFLRISISFFVRISSIIFIAEAMFPEKIVEGAAFAMMKTVVISNRIRVATVRNGRNTIQKIRMKNNNVNGNDAYEK